MLVNPLDRTYAGSAQEKDRDCLLRATNEKMRLGKEL
jgi:hypothetical protein